MKFNSDGNRDNSNKNCLTKSKSKLKTINPATEQVLNEYEIITKEHSDELVREARQAFLEWKSSIDKRANFLYAFAKELRKNREYLAKTATEEMGKPIKEARSEVEKCAWTIEYYSDNGKIFHQRQSHQSHLYHE